MRQDRVVVYLDFVFVPKTFNLEISMNFIHL